jgi:hypothetical protein
MRLTMPRRGSAATTRSVIGAYCSRMPRASFARRDHVVLALALREVEPDAVAIEDARSSEMSW